MAFDRASESLINAEPSPRPEGFVRLSTVDGFIAFDLPEVPMSGGGTRLAPDVTEVEISLLARAMTYKFAVLGMPIAGAKAGIRCEPSQREQTLERFRREIAPMVASGRLMTGPDLGTSEADFADLPIPGRPDGIAAGRIAGLPAEEYMTGFAAGAAIDAALACADGGLDGRRAALEGFGKVGAGVAREIEARGGSVVAVSTLKGCAIAPNGGSFSADDLLSARADWGDELVHHLGVEARARETLWSVPADVVVPGARAGVIDGWRARRLTAPIVVPVANAPYTKEGLGILEGRGVAAHADFAVSSGGAMAYFHPEVAGADSPAAALRAIDRVMREMIRDASAHPGGPYAGAVQRARDFLDDWLGDDHSTPPPPLA